MEELAGAIGISRPTLSRYFQDPSSVRTSTAARIREGLSRVDYVPNFFATRLNRKATRLIGLVLPHFNDLFYTGLMGAMEAAANAADYRIIMLSSQACVTMQALAVETFLSMSADGVVVAPLGEEAGADALLRLAANVPTVFVDCDMGPALGSVDFVGTDNRQSIGVIVDHLCRTGPPPVFLSMPDVNSNAAGRDTAFVERMRRHGHAPRMVLPERAAPDWGFEAYADAVMDSEFSRGRLRGDTILCANDRLAIGAQSAAYRHGLLSRTSGFRIAGHDDHPLSRFMTPPLTTVAQDIAAIGAGAIELLVRRIAEGGGHGSVRRTFEATLKIRTTQ